MLGLGGPELLVILVIAVLIFGPSRLPKMGKALGETIASFRGIGKELDDIHQETEQTLRGAGREVDETMRGVARDLGLKPSYNHRPGDSPLTPCPICRDQEWARRRRNA